MTSTSTERTQVVIVGGGFSGLYAAKRLSRAPVRIQLIDRRNHHLFQPLLYQVATAALAAPDIATPIRHILSNQGNVTVLMEEVTDLDLEACRVHVRDGSSIGYDYLILATGSVTSYFGHEDWKRHAPGLKSIEDAFEIRRRVLLAFERAERNAKPAALDSQLRFLVVGAGPTGVELAGALREIAQKCLARDYRNFDPSRAEVLLLDGSDRVLPGFPPALSKAAAEQLEARGVSIRTGEFVEGMDEGGVVLKTGERIEAGTILWAAGVRPSPLAEALGAATTKDGRVLVQDDLSLPGHREVFVAGDLAAVRQENGDWVPGLAAPAIQMGRHAADSILQDLRNRERRPFVYKHRGLLATIGRSAAVAELGGRHFRGFPAWILWVFVHIFWLIGFRRRLLVLFEWAWAWLTWQRSARVILERREDREP